MHRCYYIKYLPNAVTPLLIYKFKIVKDHINVISHGKVKNDATYCYYVLLSVRCLFP